MADAQDSGSCGDKPRGGSNPPIRTKNKGVFMEKISYLILIIISIIWLLAIIFGFIMAFPYGIIGIFLILAFGLLFIKVIKEKLEKRREEEKYKNIKW